MTAIVLVHLMFFTYLLSCFFTCLLYFRLSAVFKANKLHPFSSVFPAAKYVVRLCHQYWASEDTLPKITQVPILFLSGLKDEIVPYVLYFHVSVYETHYANI